ncbi:hypothetical protein ACFQ58_10480 [Agromyces sp. NPDC056523]|uniref:hypothetical protein n=1 Tax=Agromyces sp. NPDC056523 TaxID=3345850 RepID=UPI00366B428E
MHNATNNPQERADGVMNEVEAFNGAARGRIGARRATNAIDRIGAFSGTLYVLLALLGSALIGERSNRAESPGEQILEEQQRYAENPWTNVAFAVVILAQLALILFVGYLCARVREAGWFATTALVGGTAALIANFLSVSIVIAVFVLRDNISTELARALQDLDGAGHLIQLLPLGVFAVFTSVAALVTRTLGPVLSWAGIAIGAMSIVVLAASGLPANDEFFVWPFLLILLWMTVISLRFGFARNRTATPDGVAQTDP